MVSNPKIPILRKVFDEKTLFNIFTIKNWIQGIKDEKLRYFFLTALLSVVDNVAYAKKGGGFLRLTPDKEIADIKDVIFTKVNEMVIDIDIDHRNIENNVDSNVFWGDARKICFSEEAFDAIITSPPPILIDMITRGYIF
ncbi:hypothetical protein C5S53_05790 [Methanophagales archaeon]|jgi:hypothetical protein|nr:hypothetical protein C5S53_05790 [Methanophagales archaeon]